MTIDVATIIENTTEYRLNGFFFFFAEPQFGMYGTIYGKDVNIRGKNKTLQT